MSNTLQIKVNVDAQPVQNLRRELKETKLAIANATDPADIERLVVKAAELQDKFADINEQVAVFASGSKYEQVGNSLGQVGQALRQMDFEKVQERAVAFSKVAKSISFGDAIKSVKQLGSAFLSIGKAILANPLFLVAAIVAAVIAAIVKLMDELGLLTAIFEAVGEAIGWVIQQLKDFLDWMGLTDYAGEKYAQDQIDRNVRLQESYQRLSDKQVAGIEHEIALKKARGEDATQLEREKLAMLKKSADEQVKLAMNTALHIMKLHGKDSDEFKEQAKAIWELEKQAKQASRNIELFEVQTTEDKKKRDKKSADDSMAKAKKAAEDKKRLAEEIAKAQLAADLMIQEANIMAIENEIERDRQLARFKADQAFKAIELTKLTQSQVEALTVQHQMRLDEIDKLATEKIETNLNADNDKKIQAQKDYEQQMFDLRAETIAKQIEAFQMVQDAETEALRQKYDEGLISKEQFEAGKFAIEEKYLNEIGSLREEEANKEKARSKAVHDGALDLASGVLAGIGANLKEGSKAAKGIAVAQATMDTYRAAVAAFASTASSPISVAFPAAPYIAAASAVAMGIGNIRKILATEPSKGGGSTPSGGGGGQAPSFGSAQTAQTPNMNFNEGIEQNAGGSVNREKVMVVDYYDIQTAGNNIDKSNKKITLA